MGRGEASRESFSDARSPLWMRDTFMFGIIGVACAITFLMVAYVGFASRFMEYGFSDLFR